MKAPGPDFVQLMIDKGCLKEVSEPSEGDSVVYFDNCGKIKYSGRLVTNSENDFDKIVSSRWGVFGGVFEHKLFDIPLDYGDIAKYYLMTVTPHKILEELMNYSLLKEMSPPLRHQ